MEQAFSEPYRSMKHKCTTTKEIERIILPQNKTLIQIRRDIHKDPKNKQPLHKFSNKLHM